MRIRNTTKKTLKLTPQLSLHGGDSINLVGPARRLGTSPLIKSYLESGKLVDMDAEAAKEAKAKARAAEKEVREAKKADKAKDGD